MASSLCVSADLAVTPEELFKAWLDGAIHAAFTESAAKCVARVGCKFSAWDGYITGKNLELQNPSRIVQSWRTTDFAASDADSRLEILLDPIEGGTHITLHHTELPDGEAPRYLEGWEEFYFVPMRNYFGQLAKPKKSAATKKPVATKKSTPKMSAPAAKKTPAKKATKAKS
jgi:activator of HSP90 ATPase